VKLIYESNPFERVHVFTMSTPTLRPRTSASVAVTAPARDPDDWLPLENDSGICFAVSTLEVLLRCRPLWRHLRWSQGESDGTATPRRLRTECLDRLRLLFHALVRQSDSTADLVTAFLSQEVFGRFVSRAYRRRQTGGLSEDFLLDIINACAEDTGSGLFLMVGIQREAPVRITHTAAISVDEPSGVVPRTSPPLIMVIFHDHTQSRTEPPPESRLLFGLRYDWVGSVLYHRNEGGLYHATAIVRSSRQPGGIWGRSGALFGDPRFPFVLDQPNFYALSLYELRAEHFVPRCLYAPLLASLSKAPAPQPFAVGDGRDLDLLDFVRRHVPSCAWVLTFVARCRRGHTPSVVRHAALVLADFARGPNLSLDGHLDYMATSPTACPECGDEARMERLQKAHCPKFALLVPPFASARAPPPSLVRLSGQPYRYRGFAAVRADEASITFHRMPLTAPEARTMSMVHFFVYRRQPLHGDRASDSEGEDPPRAEPP